MGMIQQKRSLVVVFGVVVSMLLFLSPVGAEEPGAENLLQNPSFEEGSGQKVPGWSFHRGATEGEVEWGIIPDKTSQGAQCLRIAKMDSGTHDHVWLYQNIDALPGTEYTISFKAKGWGGANYGVSVGCEFKGIKGEWLGYKNVCTVAGASEKWPSAFVPAVREWKEFSGKVTPPPGAATMGIRLSLDATSPSEAYFKDIRISAPSMTMKAFLERMPAQIPVYRITLQSVSAGGTTLMPDWSLDDAERVQSGCRQKFCLNGLWAIQPSNGIQAPQENDWAFFKVPGFFVSHEHYMVYGQNKTSWSKLNIRNVPHLWYVREIDVVVPDKNKAFLEVSGMCGMALRVYWNGKSIGYLTNQQGGRLELPAQDGRVKGQIAFYVTSAKREHQYAYLVESGQAQRFYDPQSVNLDRGILDIYLNIEPEHPIVGWSRAEPSTRNKRLNIRLGHDKPIPEGAKFTVKVCSADGNLTKRWDDVPSVKSGRDTLMLGCAWDDAKYWTPETPYLYTYTVAVLNEKGGLLDETLPDYFGFREVWVDGKYLMLNGQKLRLRPKHIGSFFMDGQALRRHFSFLKDIGFNCVLRPPILGTTHEFENWSCLSTEQFLDIADEMGMLVIPYTAYMTVSGGQFGEKVQENIDAILKYIEDYQVHRMGNHPSVIAYSGFGAGVWEGINTVNLRPDIWGVYPFTEKGILEKLLSDSAAVERAKKVSALSKQFIDGVKQLDPSRPFLSHYDGGEGDGWGIFDYFNWTPLQEWEEWPAGWAKNGIKPIGSTEHGLPYPVSFVNHGIPDGDNEPWVTEYSAITLGNQSYGQEPAEYLSFIRSSYDKEKRFYLSKRDTAYHLDIDNPNIQRIWSIHNRAIYRTWRTYGLPMGIEPFTRSQGYISYEQLRKSSGQVVADARANLKATGLNLDKWQFNSYWPSETMPYLPSQPTGRKPEHLTMLGETLYEVNNDLLAYIAGPPECFTDKGHVFWSGERIVKQIAVIWDGFHDRRFSAEWSVVVNNKQIAQGTLDVSVPRGEIRLIPFEFTAPSVSGRVDGEIKLELKDLEDRGKVVASDTFQIHVREQPKLSDKLKNARISLFDPIGESMAPFTKLGLSPVVVKSLAEVKDCDLLVIGRKALPALVGQPLEQLPSTTSIMVLEQTDKDLENVGFRAFPSRSRMAFHLPRPHPALTGIAESELRDWRVCPNLLPEGVMPLRDGYNWHTGYRGTIASVTMECPTSGNFTPLLQSGFDLRETPLLEGQLDGRRWLFCQLSLIEGCESEPAANTIFLRLLEWMTAPSPALERFCVLGDNNDVRFARELGAETDTASHTSTLGSTDIALVGKVTDQDFEALGKWVKNGGTAVLLPQPLNRYKMIPTPSIKAASMIPFHSLPDTEILNGLGQNDFHYRQPLNMLTFYGTANIADINDGKGRWVLLGFNPRDLKLDDEPYLRLTYRHQCRAISQILTNLGVSLPTPMRMVLERIKQSPINIDITSSAVARIAEKNDSLGNSWIKPEFDDSQWKLFGLATKSTQFGHAFLRIKFTAPELKDDGGLIADLGTMDDYDETYLNGVRIGSINPTNSMPDTAFGMRRLYPLPAGLLRPGQENVLAIYVWNRNAESKGWKAWVRGPMHIRRAEPTVSPYAGNYKHSDDPYLQRHW